MRIENGEYSQNEIEASLAISPLGNWELLVQALVDRAYSFAKKTRDPQDIHDAWRTFRVWLSSWIDYESEDWRLFLVWYVFHWQAPDFGEPKKRARSIAEECLKESEGVSGAERNIVAVAVASPMDFYEIYALPEPKCFYMKSLFLGFQHSFAFDTLPEGMKVGDIFFGKIIQFHHDQGVIAAHSRPFSASAKVSIAHIRRQLVKGRKGEFVKNFSLFDTDLFNLYQDLLADEANGP